MKSRQRRQHMHEQRVHRKAAKAAQKRNNARGYGVSKTSTKSRVPRQMVLASTLIHAGIGNIRDVYRRRGAVRHEDDT
jgi:hypothetical protein